MELSHGNAPHSLHGHLAHWHLDRVAVVGIILTWRVPKPRWVFVLALAAILGALRYNLAQPRLDQTSLATYNDQRKSVMVEGIVVGEPDVRDTHTNLRVEADHLLISNLSEGVTRTVRGLVLVQAPPFTDFRYGDRIRVEGKLQTPTNSDEFDYCEYLARQDAYSIMSRPRLTVLAHDQGFAPFGWLYSFRAHATLTRVITQTLRVPEPQASLLTGILLGDDSGITHSVQDAFRSSSLSKGNEFAGPSQIIVCEGECTDRGEDDYPRKNVSRD